MIKENIKEIKKNIKKAAEKSGRSETDITLVAVSKTVEPSRINEAIDCGVTDIGENYVQELLEKYDAIKRDKINLHFIGHLQRNKVKYIVDKVDSIDSVDSYELAAEIDKRCKAKNIVMDVLVQVNIGDEQSKSGVDANGVCELVRRIGEFENLNVKGLMCIPPIDCDATLFDEMKSIAYSLELNTLSMGMSGDYETAIEHGSTCVRIGTSVFGERNYNK